MAMNDENFDALLKVHHLGRQLALLETALRCVDGLGPQGFTKSLAVDMAKAQLQALHTQCERSIARSWRRRQLSNVLHTLDENV